MKWDELSMAQKNELMQTYIRNGVISLDDMKSHFNSFALGGDKDNPDNPPTDAISGPDRYWEKDPMKSKTGFYEWWLSNRQKQLENAALSKRKHMISMPKFLIRDSKIKQDATQVKDNFVQSIRDYDEFIIPFEGINDSTYKGFENARVNSIGKEAALRHQNAIEEFIDRPLTTDPNKALNRLRIGAAGVTLPGEKVIYYPEIGLWNNIEKSTIIHERNHAGDYGDSRMVDMIFWDDVNEYGKKFSNYNNRKQPYLLDGVKKSDYYDDAKEIKSRLMEFRYNNNLNPTHTYTIEEIEQMRNNKNTIDENLFNRYSNEFIYHLLNDIAYNNQEKGDEHQVKFGGYLFANGGPKKTYKQWSNEMHTKYPWLELDPNKAGYDYERYFNENYDDAIARLNEAEARHFTDRYKLPNHPTFSNESIYSQGPSIGGSWTEEDKFIPSIINVQQHPRIFKENRPYTEKEIYGREFATGGPKDPPDKQKMGWFARASMNAAMADNPAYMQAIGWTQDKEGNYHQDPTTEGAKELSKALYEIGVNTATEVFGTPILEKGIKAVKNSKRVNAAIDRVAEALVRQGDNLPNPANWDKKGMLNYIVKGGKNPELAYKAGPYSGEDVIAEEAYMSHPEDVVDAFFNKKYQLESHSNDIPNVLKKYVQKYYPNKNIKVYDLGDIRRLSIDEDMAKKVMDNPNILGNNDVVYIDGNPIVDVGGHNRKVIRGNNSIIIDNSDIWKFNGADLDKSHNYGLLGRIVGDFIDSRGTPLIHEWRDVYPIRKAHGGYFKNNLQ